MERRMARAVGAGSVAGAVTGSMFSGGGSSARKPNQNKEQRSNTASSSFGSRAGAKAGAVMDTKNRVKDKAQQVKEAVKDMPIQAGYAVYSATENAKKTVSDFKRGVTQEQETRQSGRSDKLNQRRQSVAQKRMEMQKAQEARHSEKQADGSATTGATRPHDRPVTAFKANTGKMQEIKRPVTADKVHTETTSPQPVKERPLASKSDEPIPQKHGTRLNGVELNRQTTRKERNIKKATINTTEKKGRKK